MSEVLLSRLRLSAAAPIVGVLCLCTILLGPSAASALKPLPNGVDAPIVWHECEPFHTGLQCARIRVPLDYDNPGGRTISLALIKHRASKPKQKIGTLFINPGGPGDSGVNLVKGAGSEIDAWGGGRFDVVSWDPRGTNGSTRVRCFRSKRAEARFWAGVSLPYTEVESARFAHKISALAGRCAEVSGWLLAHVSTADTARDIDHLRALLGERRTTYVGLSYGSYLGQTYANLFPGRVRAMLLEGLVDAPRWANSAESRAEEFVGGADDVFREFLANCRRVGPRACALAGGEETAGERFHRFLSGLRQESIPAPALYPAPSSTESLSYAGFLLSQFQPMRSPAAWPANAEAIRSALEGNASALQGSARGWVTPDSWNAVFTSNAVQCADGPATRPLSDWRQVLARMKKLSWSQGIVHTWWTWAACAAWRVPGQDSYRGPWNRERHVPILLINQTFDPNTAYANAVKAEEYLPDARLLTLDGYGHLPFQDPSACVEKAQTAYLVQLKLPPKGAVCQPDRRPFDPEFGQPLE